MKITTSSILQGLSWVAAAGTLYSGQVPKNFQPYFFAVTGIAGVILHLYAATHDTAGNVIVPQAMMVNAIAADQKAEDKAVDAAAKKEGL